MRIYRSPAPFPRCQAGGKPLNGAERGARGWLPAQPLMRAGGSARSSLGKGGRGTEREPGTGAHNGS